MTASGSSRNWRKGLVFAATTALLWGMLPIGLKIALQGMDAFTVTWYRFVIAGTLLIAILGAARRLPAISRIAAPTWRLLLFATLGIAGNYVLFLFGLAHTTPSIAQVVSQLGPMFLMLGGVVVFGERMSASRAAGVAVLIVGLLVFFNRRLPEVLNMDGSLGIGVAILTVATFIWSSYGLAQKSLQQRLDAHQILALVFTGSIIAVSPFASPSELGRMSAAQLGALLFCGLNTLVAYGCFAESLKHWEVSRVGAVLATTPLFTLTSMYLLERAIPGVVAPERLNSLAVFGALMVVTGSALCAGAGLGRSREALPQ